MIKNLGPATDTAGNEVSADVLALAMEEKTLSVEFGGFVQRFLVQRNRAPLAVVERYNAARFIQHRRNRTEAGFTDADFLPGAVWHEDTPEAQLKADPRFAKFVELQSVEDEELRTARANLAAACILGASDPLGKLDTITGADLLNMGTAGDAAIFAIVNFTQSSPLELKAAGESAPDVDANPVKTTKANTSASSTSTPMKTKAKPRRISASSKPPKS